MKISELTQIAQVSRGIKIPICVNGQNMSVTVGQLIDTLLPSIVPFEGIDEPKDAPVIAAGSTAAQLPVVYNEALGGFYACLKTTVTNAGIESVTTTYYTSWSGKEAFYEEEGEGIRTGCLFVAADGRLYRHDGTSLITAGISTDQSEAIELSRPIEVGDEETMLALIESGNAVEGQWYFIPEEE